MPQVLSFGPGFTHRPLSSSFYGLYIKSYRGNPKKELLRGQGLGFTFLGASNPPVEESLADDSHGGIARKKDG